MWQGNKMATNVTFLGAAGVGKTYLIANLLQDNFTPEPDHKEITEYSYTFSDKDYNLIDTLENDPMSEDHIKKSDGFVIVYNITSMDSFQSAKAILEDIRKCLSVECKLPVLLVANKANPDNEPEVLNSEAVDFAKQCNITFYELEVVNADTVMHMMTQLQSAIEKCPLHQSTCSKKVEPQKKKSCCVIQ